MGAMTRSVGAGGVNVIADVTEIQRLLNLVPGAKGGASPPFTVSAPAMPPRERRSCAFRRRRSLLCRWPHHPGRPTLTKLNALAAASSPTGSLVDVTRARGIAKMSLHAVEPSITGFISVSTRD